MNKRDNSLRNAAARARHTSELAASKKLTSAKAESKMPKPAPDAAPEESRKNPYLRMLAKIEADNGHPQPR
jgi:hypothetical protein